MHVQKKKFWALKIALALAVCFLAVAAGFYHSFLNPYRNTASWDSLWEIPPYDRRLTREQAIADLNYMVMRIAERHLAAANGLPAAVAAQHEMEIKNMPDGPRVVDLSAAASRILHQLGDAHASILYYTDGMKQIKLDLNKSGGLLLCTSGPRAGQQVVEIDGVPVEELYEVFLKQFSYENIYYGEHQFPSYLKTEYGLNWLGLPVSGSVAYTFHNRGIPETERYEFSEDVEIQSSDGADFVSYTIDPESKTGIFTLDACFFNTQYTETLRDFFTRVKEAGIEAVAVDLRNNGGGNSQVANEFMRYLPLEEYADYGSRVRYNFWVANNDNQVRRNEQYKDLLFDGELYILTSKATFSSGKWFAVLLRDNNLGRVIGEPPGNRPSAYGDVLLFQMPESNLLFMITYKQFTRPDTTRDSEDALWPDYPGDPNEAVEEFYRLVSGR